MTDEMLVGRLTAPAFVPDTDDATVNVGDLRAILDRLSSLEEEKRAHREALEQIAETPNAGWMIARTALSAGVGPLHTPMMENR